MKKLNKLLALVLTYIMMMSSLVTSASSVDGLARASESHKEQRLINVFNNQVEQLQQATLEDGYESSNVRSGKTLVLSIKRIVELRDFAENLYTLIELSPSGYMIYHNASGIFTESSPTAPSPYEGLDDDLYYGGFTEYFYVSENMSFTHTLTDDVTEIATAEESNWADYSAELSNNFLEFTDYAVLDYVKYGTEFQTRGTTSAWTNVTNWTFVQSQTDVNNPGDICPVTRTLTGFCSYVALAILIGYLDHVPANRNVGIITNSSYVKNKHTSSAKVQQAFVSHLRDTVGYGQLGLGYSINITSSRNVGKQYFQNKSVWNHITDTLNTNALTVTNARIKTQINNSRPVIICGANLPNIGKKDRHAVVGYGYRTESSGAFTVRTNYGWGSGYGDIWVTGFSWDGMLSFTVTP